MGLEGRLLSELLRPQQLGDLTLPRRVIARLQRMNDEQSFMNMLFYGQPGIGKTSAARILGKAAGEWAFGEINGSDTTGVDFVRTTIKRMASSVVMGPARQKIIFIDEADYISKPAQAALRKVIEEYSENCRFLFAVNDVSKIIPALRSRLVSVCFDLAGADRAEVKERLFRRYADVLSREGIHFEEKRLVELIGIWYPDLRSIANQVQFEFA